MIRDLKPYSSARDEYSGPGSGMVFLDANENPFENGVNRYPDPHQKALKEQIARLRGVPVGQVLLGNGSDEVLDLLFRVFCEPYRDAVITLPPTYGMYGVLAGINGVRNLEIPLNTDFQPDNGAILEQAGEGVKMLFLCSPNNPSGNALDREKVLELLEAFPGLVVIDEAYIDFADEPGYASLLNVYPRLVVVQTLSKAYGMAGIRLGICLAGEEVISLMKRVKPPYNVNVLSQQHALKALLDPSGAGREISRLKEERSRLAAAFADLRMVEKVFPSQANFILARVDDAPARYRELLEAGIVVRDRSTQFHCENTLRFTVGTPEENERLIAVLKQMDQTQNA
jgi:histidinol-phosphate aminotransferase